MNIKFQFKSAAFALSLASLAIVSCAIEDEFEVNTVPTKDDTHLAKRAPNSGPGGSSGSDELGHHAYYSWIRCGSENTEGGIAELKAYYKEYDQCRCLTEEWKHEFCIYEPGSMFVYNYCTETTSPNVPIGALCSW